ncbi:alcohol dehydrogenase catalytic domain-containing protein [Arthrobacter sp. B2a2-09]|uniref:alcohol dehydrogenase catalytic domain-containing protein n=1 Tax=Arthrobacter sp. B2a2-09 TaxID=2952822 RepID=UPI0022CD6F2D|nr:alcohol dehydrogenase catalytic domain-containing protein [Arthrobacter sp. B2a2-09]MCZ9882580.1 alcohol dehydrogenase catalytic domain-containing protein [Arthrobacter sp. B2a2-09]
MTKPNSPLELVDREVPVPLGPGEEVIRVLACGVCHSDLHVADGDFGGPYPVVLGHEVVGEHDELGRVLLYAPWGCGRADCRQCSAGLEMICPNGREAGIVSDGGYSEYMRVPKREYLVPIGDMDPSLAAPLACGGLTAFRAVKRTLPHLRGKNSRAIVIGAGGLGQFAIQFLKALADVELTVVDTSPEKLNAAASLGADVTCGVEGLTGKYDAVIDFVGAGATMAAAASSIDRQGIIVVVGLWGGRIEFGVGVLPSEAVLTTSIWGSLDELKELLEFARTHPLQHSVETIPLDQAQHAHDLLRAGSIKGRAVLVMD